MFLIYKEKYPEVKLLHCTIVLVYFAVGWWWKAHHTVFHSSCTNFSEEGTGNSLQYSGLENSMGRGDWWAAYSPWCHKELDTTTGEPGGLQSMGSLRVRHDWATSLSLFTFMRWRRKWQPTPVFLPGESQGWGSLVGCHLWHCIESDMTEAT